MIGEKLMKAISKKSLVLVIMAVVLVAVIAIGGTVAYFSGQDEVTNTFVMGKIDIDFDEPEWSDGDGDDLSPGAVLGKDPTVTATQGQSYMRVRMEIVDGEGNFITDEARRNLILETLFYDRAFGTDEASLKDGELYSTSDLQALAASGKIDAQYNKTDFVFAGIETGNPAVRYYNYIANDGIFDADSDDAKVAVLFTNVVISNSWHNEEIFVLSGDEYEAQDNGAIEVTEKGTGYKIRLSAEAMQSSEMADAATAFNELNNAMTITIDASGI